MKAAIEREESEACFNYPEREQARPQVKSEEFATAEQDQSKLVISFFQLSTFNFQLYKYASISKSISKQKQQNYSLWQMVRPSCQHQDHDLSGIVQTHVGTQHRLW